VDNNVPLIFEDQSGTIWITTFSGDSTDLSRQTEQFTHYIHDSDNPNSLSYNRGIVSMHEYPAGTLWIGHVMAGGLDSFDPLLKPLPIHRERCLPTILLLAS
jgi:hypothetical protein